MVCGCGIRLQIKHYTFILINSDASALEEVHHFASSTGFPGRSRGSRGCGAGRCWGSFHRASFRQTGVVGVIVRSGFQRSTVGGWWRNVVDAGG